jgi:hypothetical protein
LFCVDRAFCPTVTRDSRNDVMHGKVVCALLQILHHGHLLKGEVSQDDPQSNLKSLSLAHAMLNLITEPLYVQNRLLICIAGELSQELVRLQNNPELLMQHMQQD